MQRRPTQGRPTCGWCTSKAAESACVATALRGPSRVQRLSCKHIPIVPRPSSRCYDGGSCADRAAQTPQLTSSQVVSGNVTSSRWPQVLQLSGMFSTNPRRNPWAGANLVLAAYCSSDDWLGATGGKLPAVTNAGGGLGWQFQGQELLKAILAVLSGETAFGLGSLAGTRLLLAGCDAGGRGVLGNLDDVRYMVPDTVELRGFADAAVWPDLVPLFTTTIPLTEVTQRMYGLVNGSARVGPTCGAVYANASDAWQCLFPQFRLPLVATPLLVANSQFDTVTLGYDVGGLVPPFSSFVLPPANTNVPNISSAAYVAAFQMAVRGTVSLLPSKLQPASAAFAPACAGHCSSLRPAFWGVRVGHMSLRIFLSDWYFGGNSPEDVLASGTSPSFPIGVPPVVMETCFTYSCGLCHPKGSPKERWEAENAAAGGKVGSSSDTSSVAPGTGDSIRDSDSLVSDAAASSEATHAAVQAAKASHTAGSSTLGALAVASLAGFLIIACGGGACRTRKQARAPAPAPSSIELRIAEAQPLLPSGALRGKAGGGGGGAAGGAQQLLPSRAGGTTVRFVGP